MTRIRTEKERQDAEIWRQKQQDETLQYADMHGELWTETEDDFILNNRNYMNVKQMAIELGRSWKAVSDRKFILRIYTIRNGKRIRVDDGKELFDYPTTKERWKELTNNGNNKTHIMRQVVPGLFRIEPVETKIDDIKVVKKVNKFSEFVMKDDARIRV